MTVIEKRLKWIEQKTKAYEAEFEQLLSQSETSLDKKAARLEEAKKCADLYNGGMTVEEVSIETGLSTTVVRGRLKQAGVTMWQHAKRAENSRTDHSEMIRLREQKMSYQEIGNRHGITRERVRQILKRERPDLCGFIYKTKTRKCVVCGKKDIVASSIVSVTCSKECTAQLRRTKTLRLHDEQISQALNMRRANVSWKDIGERLGVSTMTIHRWILRPYKAGLLEINDPEKIFKNGAWL